jgi:hypothetical protein
LAIVLVAAVLSSATSRPRMARNFPAWRVMSEPTKDLGCARAEAWVARSGKTGLGLTVKIATPAVACAVTIEGATFVLGAERIAGKAEPPTLNLPIASEGHFWVTFAFDNDAAWNRGARDGKLELTIRATDHTPVVWTLNLHHELKGGTPHVLDRDGRR